MVTFGRHRPPHSLMTLTQSLFIIACLIAASGFFAVAEISLAASRRLRLRQQADEGDLRADKVLKMQEQPGDDFTVVQVGQNGIAILGGEIRHHQNVANTGGGNAESRCIGQVSQASSRCSRSCNAGTDLSHASVCHTSHTQTANQGSNAQREKIFLHGNSS